MINGSVKKVFVFLGLLLVLILALIVTGRSLDLRTLTGITAGAALLMFGSFLIMRGKTKKS